MTLLPKASKKRFIYQLFSANLSQYFKIKGGYYGKI